MAVRPTGLKVLVPALLLLLTALAPRAAEAADSDEAETRSTARWHFHRGLSLFNQGDNDGALAEFRRAYELVPNPRVRYNLGLTHAARGDPVKALEALEPLASERALSPEQREHVRQVVEEQRQRIGQLSIVTNVAGALLEIDGTRVGRLPLAAPLRLAVGRRLIAVSAPGHVPRRAEALIAGRTLHELRLDLEPSEATLATLAIATNVPDVELFVDNQLTGMSPLAGSLVVAPGTHVVRAARKGYRSVTRSIGLGAGASSQLTLTLEEDPAALRVDGGRLALAISEPEAEVFINGVPQGSRYGGFSLPGAGTRCASSGKDFFPADRLITIQSRRLLEERVELLPTPQYRADYVQSAQRRRAWAYGIGGGGLVLLGASTGFLLWNASEERESERDFDATADSFDPGGACDRQTGLPPAVRAECEARLEQRLATLDDVRSREKYGWIGAGVGAAALGAGLYLFLSGDDPTRYDPKPESDVFGSLQPRLFWQPGGGGASVAGVF